MKTPTHILSLAASRLGRLRPRPSRRASQPSRPAPAAPQPAQHRVPWWVSLLTDAGRPIVAVVVLIMCAPGEHHLGRLAGWNDELAWGMAAVLAAYAGIAAAVASKRPQGAPGRTSAVVGAWLSLAAAMTAQALSHAIVTGHIDTQPRVPLWLVLSVSAVPPLVFGHLLHLAATPTGTPPVPAEPARETPAATPVPPTSGPVPAAVPAAAWLGALPAGRTALPIVARDTETDAETDQDEDGESRLIATKEVAALCDVSMSTVRTWVDRGRLTPVVRDARNGMLFDRDAVASLS